MINYFVASRAEKLKSEQIFFPDISLEMFLSMATVDASSKHRSRNCECLGAETQNHKIMFQSVPASLQHCHLITNRFQLLDERKLPKKEKKRNQQTNNRT